MHIGGSDDDDDDADSPAMACGSAEYSWTSNTPQSKDAFSFLSLEAEGAILNKPWDTKRDDTRQKVETELAPLQPTAGVRS